MHHYLSLAARHCISSYRRSATCASCASFTDSNHPFTPLAHPPHTHSPIPHTPLPHHTHPPITHSPHHPPILTVVLWSFFDEAHNKTINSMEQHQAGAVLARGLGKMSSNRAARLL